MKEHNLAPVAEITNQIEKQEYGSLSVTYDIFQGKIVGILGTQFQKRKFNQGENASATALVLAEIKDNHDKKSNGMVSFSVKFTEGDCREVYIQRNLRRNYELTKESLSSKAK